MLMAFLRLRGLDNHLSQAAIALQVFLPKYFVLNASSVLTNKPSKDADPSTNSNLDQVLNTTNQELGTIHNIIYIDFLS